MNALESYGAKYRPALFFMLAENPDIALSVHSFWTLEDMLRAVRACKALRSYMEWLRGCAARRGVRTPCVDAMVKHYTARECRLSACNIRSSVSRMETMGAAYVTHNKRTVAKAALHNLAQSSLTEQRPRIKRARRLLREAREDALGYDLVTRHEAYLQELEAYPLQAREEL